MPRIHPVAALLVLLVLPPAAGAEAPPALVGTWTAQLGGQEVSLQLAPDGSCLVAGEPRTWSASRGQLLLGADAFGYRLEGDRLTLTDSAGETLAWARAAPRGGQQAAAREPAPGKAGKDRRLRINGRALDARHLETLARLERAVGRLEDREYWYDPVSGATGLWGGPALAFLPPGLELPGPLPAEASGGGRGALTGVFVNGRELHPVDVAALQQLVGQVLPGRWWVDAQSNYGLEHGPALGNLGAIAAARRRAGQGGNSSWSKRYEGSSPSGNMNLASDGTTTCVSVSGYSRCTGE
jgi:hypothetical protein